MSYEKLGFQSGQLLKAEHLNHIEDGIYNLATGGGGVSSWNDLTDKPFGEYLESRLIGCENVTTITEEFTLDILDNVYYRSQAMPLNELGISSNGEEGQTTRYNFYEGDDITVIFDGVEYKVKAKYEDHIHLCFGNFNMYYTGLTNADENDNSLPFFCSLNDEIIVWTGTNDSDSHTISIYKDTYGIKKLDEAYIPDTLASKYIPCIKARAWGYPLVITAGETRTTAPLWYYMTEEEKTAEPFIPPIIHVYGDYVDDEGVTHRISLGYEIGGVSEGVVETTDGNQLRGDYINVVATIPTAIDYDIAVTLYSNYAFYNSAM